MEKPARSTHSLFREAADIPGPSKLKRAISRALRPRNRDSEVGNGSAAAPGDPLKFESTSEGSGAFGQWKVDQAGLPAYEYTLNQYRSRRASFPNTEWIDRRDHWHQLGNDRITALASNDGIIQVYLNDRGGVFLNRFDPPAKRAGFLGWLAQFLGGVVQWYRQFRVNRLIGEWQKRVTPRGNLTNDVQKDRRSNAANPPQPNASLHEHAYSGGYSYLDDSQETWATAYRYRPPGPETKVHTRRIFGMSYFETELTYRDIHVQRQVYAPYGDDPVLLVDVLIENTSSTPLKIRHYEYWDVNVYQLESQMVRTGLAAASADEIRYSINDNFIPSVDWDHAWPGQALRFHQEPIGTVPGQSDPSPIDWHPADIFLLDLSDTPQAHYTDKAAFFSQGGAARPTAVHERRDGETAFRQPSNSMPYCLVLRRDLYIEPGKDKAQRLRYAYGTIKPGESLEYLRKYETAETLKRTLDSWKCQLAYFTTGDPVLQREMAWHAYNILSATVYQEFYHAHVVPQGSAYLYLHGLDGVPRDHALFAIPLTYLRPDIARETLTLIMNVRQSRNNALPYAISGFGWLESPKIHEQPSDLDLFFLLALAEYIAATGDVEFLDQPVEFYPRGTQPSVNGQLLGTTVLDHVRAAFAHLNPDVHRGEEGVGLGENGLIRIGDGDWSDGVVFASVMPNLPAYSSSVQRGESIPNSQMALYVLPRAAALIEAHDPDLAQQMRALETKLRGEVQKQWHQRQHWYRRAILRDALDDPLPIGDDKIDLEAQPWALISDLATTEGVEDQLIGSIRKHLDDRSLIGTPTKRREQVWPAISQLLTWGYTRHHQCLAWRSLNRNTFAAHAIVFPNVWYNIWSGPDAINSRGCPHPGFTWTSEVTPMTDFPAMNANPDAMALLALLRVCGIEPSCKGDGLVIAPQAPPEQFILDLPLLRLEVAPGRIAGEYRPVVKGSLVLYVRVPEAVIEILATVDRRRIPIIPSDAREVALPLTFEDGQTVPFEVSWKS